MLRISVLYWMGFFVSFDKKSALILCFSLFSFMSSTAFAAEELMWKVRYGGISIGSVWTKSRKGIDDWIDLEAGAKSAKWYQPIYPVDDVFRSIFQLKKGSKYHQAQLKEGSFHQEQLWSFQNEEIDLIWRQKNKGKWKSWRKNHRTKGLVFDPLSAIFALRWVQGEGPWKTKVFNGRKHVTLLAKKGEKQRLKSKILGPVDAFSLELFTDHKGDIEQSGKSVIYLSDDQRRLPIFIQLRSNLGIVEAKLHQVIHSKDNYNK